MCTTCGCGGADKAMITDLRHDAPGEADEHREHGHAGGTAHRHAHGEHAHQNVAHVHEPEHEHVLADGTVVRHAQAHGEDHAVEPERSRTITLEQAILAKNQQLAERNRSWLAGRDVLALNLMSAPGSGKTTLLERTLRDVGAALQIAVVEGDQATLNDARRIRATGAPVIQINTGQGCHLEADQFGQALRELNPAPGSIVVIENVGNLVCPALFDLGEHAKVVILSVTEGEDKPIKYPHMFRVARLMLLSKIDLLPHLDFDVERCTRYAREVNPSIEVLRVSARSGKGLDAWYSWLRRCRAEASAAEVTT